DVIVPDFGYVFENLHRLRGVVLTHGHEDHVGALSHLLEKARVPIYGSAYTLSYVEQRLEGAGMQADLRPIEPRRALKLGDHLSAEAVRVTHSVPEALGFSFETVEGRIIHTGDFKLDPTPIGGAVTDLPRLAELGEEGVLCLLSDSTNVEVHAETGSEQDVADTFARLLPGLTGRVVVGLFASHQHRVQSLLDLAEKLGRRVLPMGRSMVRNLENAAAQGVIRIPSGLLVSVESAASLPPEELLIITTGSQAEPRAGLATLAAGEGPVTLSRGDTVILSSTPIPGNERQVAELVDRLLWRGAEVITHRQEPGVHVSGHASRPQQRRMMETVRPRHFLPVHGELRHLLQHRALAAEVGIPAAGRLLARDGDVVSFREGVGRVEGTVPAGRWLLDRASRIPVSEDALRERLRPLDGGQLVVVLTLARDTHRILTRPHLQPLGLSSEDLQALPHVAAEIEAELEVLSVPLRGDDAWLKEALTRIARRSLRLRTGRRPWVTPVVVRV
ncbi:MAG TPA: ribonuclease J, partial [Myxococcaceae bacterium]|nr:ribonuclease J [Myxococcaceae bacterium]